MQHDEDYWCALTALSVLNKGYYWYRSSPSAEPSIVLVEGVFGGTALERQLIFFSPDSVDYEPYSLQTIFKTWPDAQISAERIVPPED